MNFFLTRVRTRVATRRKDESIEILQRKRIIGSTRHLIYVTLSFYGADRNIVIMTPVSVDLFSARRGSDIVHVLKLLHLESIYRMRSALIFFRLRKYIWLFNAFWFHVIFQNKKSCIAFGLMLLSIILANCCIIRLLSYSKIFFQWFK